MSFLCAASVLLGKSTNIIVALPCASLEKFNTQFASTDEEEDKEL
jgi:hypothetical protein